MDWDNLQFGWKPAELLEEGSMLRHEHLYLQLTELKPSEGWSYEGEGLCFIFPKRGVGTFLSGADSQPLVSGDVLVLTGGAHVKPSVTTLDEIVFFSFTISWEHFFPLFATAEVALLLNISETLKGFRHYPASSLLSRQCHRLLKDIRPQFDLGHRSQLLSVAAEILAVEFKRAQEQRRGSTISAGKPIARAFERLSSMDFLSLSLEDLTRHFNCSRRHLNRLFHQRFGVSVAALRMEVRLLKAASLLRNPSVKVQDAAKQCGFNHLGLFNTCFKRRFRVSPGAWRNRVREALPNEASEDAPRCLVQKISLDPWIGQIAEPSSSVSPVTRVPGNGTSNGHEKALARETARASASKSQNGRLRPGSPHPTSNVVPPHDEQPSNT
jgi:AraC-like DNA-binding protein